MRRPRRQLRTAGFSVAHEGDPILHHGRTDFPALLGILDRLRILFSSTPVGRFPPPRRDREALFATCWLRNPYWAATDRPMVPKA